MATKTKPKAAKPKADTKPAAKSGGTGKANMKPAKGGKGGPKAA